MNLTEEVIELKQKMEKMEKYITELEEHLKKYTNNNRHLKYYENKTFIDRAYLDNLNQKKLYNQNLDY
jgi:hypothetical protein